jgi:hypothetical protein
MEDETNGEASKVCVQLKKISDATKAFVLGVHHYGKNQELGLRGGSAFRANVDQVFAVLCDRTRDGGAKNRRLALEKNREGEEGGIGAFDLYEDFLGRDHEGDDITSCMIIEMKWQDKKDAKPDEADDDPAPAPKPKRKTQSEKAMEALLNTLDAKGMERDCYGITRDSVLEDEWKEAFYATMPDAKDGTKRQAFSAAKN